MRRMTLLPIAAVTALVVLSAPSSEAAGAEARRFAVRAERLIDGRAAAARGPVWVVVSGDTIEAVRTAAPAGLERVKWVMKGGRVVRDELAGVAGPPAQGTPAGGGGGAR